MLNFDCFRLPSISKFQFRSVITFLFLFGLFIQTGHPADWPIGLTGARRCPDTAQWEFAVRFRRVGLRRNGIPGGTKPTAVSLGPGPGTGPGTATAAAPHSRPPFPSPLLPCSSACCSRYICIGECHGAQSKTK